MQHSSEVNQQKFLRTDTTATGVMQLLRACDALVAQADAQLDRRDGRRMPRRLARGVQDAPSPRPAAAT